MTISLPKVVNSKWEIVNGKKSIHQKGFTLIELLVARHPKLQRRKATLGFTLIELLVVIGILTVLLAIVLVAINPAKQFAQANNTQRRSDVNAVLNAIHQYAADNKGSITLLNIPTGTAIPICKAGGSVSALECPLPPASTNLCAVSLLVPTYLADLPLDPTASEKDPTNQTCDNALSLGYRTGYTVVRNASNRVTVAAPSAEAEGGSPAPTISVTR